MSAHTLTIIGGKSVRLCGSGANNLIVEFLVERHGERVVDNLGGPLLAALQQILAARRVKFMSESAHEE